MCGVAGIYSLNGEKIENLEFKLKEILSSIKHRGPDQKGIFISKKKNCGLVNNRLAIVSPEEKIDLPFSKNQNHFLSFNGEIYNYEQLRHKLISKKINFKGLTDTEVLYEFLILSNDEFNFEDLNGMWSFAFYNQNKHNLLLSRDLLGEKHLFYTVQKNELIFCSEIDAILPLINNPKIDYNNLIGAWKFNIPLPGKSLIKNIFRMRPGENILIQNGSLKKNDNSLLKPDKWFNFYKNVKHENEIFEKFEEIFIEELKIRIPKNVSFFSTNSGGIDSTVLNYFLNLLSPSFNTVFGISSPAQKKNNNNLISEIQLSKKISKYFNTNHYIQNLYKEKGTQLLKQNANSCFDGCLDPGLANIMALTEWVSKKKAKVVFFADGPDELLSGYTSDIELNKLDNFLGNNKQNKLDIIKKFEFLKYMISNFLNIEKNKDFNFSYKPFRTRPNHLMSDNNFLKKFFTNFDQEKYYDFCKLDKKYDHLFDVMDFSQLRSLIYATKSLPDMFNYRLDKASMRNSVEARLPFLSKKVVEFFIAMPTQYRFSKDLKYGKMFLRNFLNSKSKFFNKYVCERPKSGFGDNFWNIKFIREKLSMKKKIKINFFKNKSFNKNAFDLITKNNKIHRGKLWNAYVISKTSENLEKFFS